MTQIKTVTDFDGYFTAMVSDALKRVGESIYTTIHITSGPYRSYAMDARRSGTELHLDFYSALRAGFGQLDQADLDRVVRG